MQTKAMVAEIKEQCKIHGIRMYFGKGKSIRLEGRSLSGYFDDDNQKLAVATGTSKWEEVLAHEFSHMMQCIEKCEAWTNYCKLGGWHVQARLDNLPVPPSKLSRDVDATVRMEMDCEIRALKFMKKYGYDNSDEYCRRANAYILFYKFIEETGKWYTKENSPYRLKEVWQHFPTHFNYNIDTTYRKLKHLYNLCIV